MNQKSVMLIAGEASGDAVAAELVRTLADALPQAAETDEVQPMTSSLRPRFFGAGGPKMAEAGVELAFDMTRQSAIGLSDVLKKLPVFERMFRQLLAMAKERQPDLIVLVDFGGFNRRFAHAIRKMVRASQSVFFNWSPKIVQYVSPQVWASRPGRGAKLAKDINLLLCLFPFEKQWYAQHVPQLRVECVGHPLFDRHAAAGFRFPVPRGLEQNTEEPSIVLLPGSRTAELRRHLPEMVGAVQRISAQAKAHFTMVLPNDALLTQALTFGTDAIPNLKLQIGGLSSALARATLAIASTGTVTLECAYFAVPTVAIYKTSWSTYEIARRIIKVRFLAMPNLLADEVLFPELIQHDATAEKIARESLALLGNPNRRQEIQAKLQSIMTSLGGPGAGQRAARAIASLFQ